MSGLCLAATGLALALGSAEATLVWTHSVERTEWRETWRAEGDGLRLVEAAVKGSGAGMEPGDGATLKGGFYVWRPNGRRETAVMFRRSGATEDWSICVGGLCRALADLIRTNADPVILRPC